jgi:hypothetical protein
MFASSSISFSLETSGIALGKLSSSNLVASFNLKLSFPADKGRMEAILGVELDLEVLPSDLLSRSLSALRDRRPVKRGETDDLAVFNIIVDFELLVDRDKSTADGFRVFVIMSYSSLKVLQFLLSKIGLESDSNI